jgi:uncharacterized LabA/DUF88 family protein
MSKWAFFHSYIYNIIFKYVNTSSSFCTLYFVFCTYDSIYDHTKPRTTCCRPRRCAKPVLLCEESLSLTGEFQKYPPAHPAGRKLTRAIAYAVDTGADDTNKVFIEALHESGFEIKQKMITTFVDGSKKADWDVGIAMDAIRLGSKVDSIVLVSGDGDFCPVVNYMQQAQGCLVEVMAFGRTTNKELRELADEFIDIEEYPDELLFQSRKSVWPQRNQKKSQKQKPQGAPKNQSQKPQQQKGANHPHPQHIQ